MTDEMATPPQQAPQYPGNWRIAADYDPNQHLMNLKGRAPSRRKTCRICGGRNEVVDGICEECEHDHVYCAICEEWHSDDFPCRHVFWAPWGEWIGVGAAFGMSDSTWHEVKESLFAVLDKTQMAEPLAVTIYTGRFYLEFFGTIFGPDSLSCRLVNPADSFTTDYGERFTDDLSEEQENAMSLGVGWLSGLYEGVTRDANQRTLSWIAEYLDRQPKGGEV